MHCLRWILASLAFYCLIPAHLCAAPQTLADYETKYQEQTSKIAGDYSNELGKAMGDYSNALDRALRDCKASGDLDGLLLLKKEIERVALQRTVPEEAPEGADVTLLKLQNGYQQAVAQAETSRRERTLVLLRQYVGALQDLLKSLVKEDKLDEAQEVNEELKKREFLLADMEATTGERREQAARQGLQDLMKVAGLPALRGHAGLSDASQAGVTNSAESTLAEAARNKRHLPNEIAEIRTAAALFRRQHGETATAKENGSLLEVLVGTKVVDLTGGVKLELVWIPPGEFLMGSPERQEGRRTDETQHRVNLTKGFWMGKYEVTQAQWERVMLSEAKSSAGGGNNPSHFKGPNLPVEQVSWDDCQEFIAKANLRLETGNLKLRLPTEAEWEYACRAGTTTRFCSGDAQSDLDAVGWCGKNSGNTTHPVGQKKANAWGLHDMHGNVWEWCQDWNADYTSGDATDPEGPLSGSARVTRGGSCHNEGNRSRSASRSSLGPDYRLISFGLRVVFVSR